MFLLILLLLIVLPVVGVALYIKSLKSSEWRVISNALYIAYYALVSIFKKLTVDQLWDEQFQRLTDKSKTVLYYVDDQVAYSWQQVEDYSNQFGHFLLSKNAQAGRSVAIMMENRPQFFWSWLGISKIGCRTALINHNLRNDALLHALRTSSADFLIFDHHLVSALEEVLPTLNSEFSHVHLCCVRQIPSLDENVTWPDFAIKLNEELKKNPVTSIPSSSRSRSRGVSSGNVFLYVYTSGTTGPSKAAKITHFRFITGCAGFAQGFNVTSEDKIYITLPLYHSAATIIGTGAILFRGASVVVRKKFSASKFTDDLKEYNCTIVQYIGEICRYLVNTPEKPNEKDHKLRLAVGNGLRPDIWKQFQTRYAIPQVGEFYAATEGPVGLLNLENHFGSIGYASPKVLKVLKAAIVKYDVETESVVRDSQGRCVRAEPNEAGEFICRVYNVMGVTNFAGYTNKEATEKKIYRDVFEKGDQWFRSGDLLKADEEGWVYFVDRIGDTFRWKGENCATSEIAEVFSHFPTTDYRFEEVNVYGVLVPGKDGRAGMACLAIKNDKNEDVSTLVNTINFSELFTFLKKNLPVYAIPLFLRFVSEMPSTSTFKHMKVQLRDEGFDPSVIKDPLMFLDFNQNTYVKLDKQMFESITSGSVKL